LFDRCDLAIWRDQVEMVGKKVTLHNRILEKKAQVVKPGLYKLLGIPRGILIGFVL
jgi:hypothetical protein